MLEFPSNGANVFKEMNDLILCSKVFICLFLHLLYVIARRFSTPVNGYAAIFQQTSISFSA